MQRQHKFLRLNIIYSGVDYENTGKLKWGMERRRSFPKNIPLQTRRGSSIKVLCDKQKKASNTNFCLGLNVQRVVANETAKRNDDEEGKKTFRTFSSSKLSTKNHFFCSPKRKTERGKINFKSLP